MFEIVPFICIKMDLALNNLRRLICYKYQPTNQPILHHHHHHHHHVVPLARISLTLSQNPSLSFIASVRSSGLHPVSSHSCWMYVRAIRRAFPRPYVGVHRSTSLMSSSLLLQRCPVCLVRLTWIVFVMGGRWPYSWCFVGCCRQDLFNIARRILGWLPSSFFFSRFVIFHVVLPYTVSIRQLPGRNCVSFYRLGLISIWSIAYW